jgi:hypothetical protein
MKLHIVIRTHDGKNIHGDRPRYIDIPKKHLIIGCLFSLINSANRVKNHSIHFTILDDHSTPKLISSLNSIFSHSIHSWELIHLQEKGFNYSGYMQFLTCKNSDADLVYSVEDDYLHQENAILEMLFTYEYLKSHYHLQKELCIFPFDNKEDYEYGRVVPGRLFRTPTRHWKEGIWTTFTMMTTPKVFQDHWEVFEKLALGYKTWNGIDEIDELIHEGNTISDIWENNVIRVNPIPSLALHVQFEAQRDPHINHLDWWNKYSKIHKFEANYD